MDKNSPNMCSIFTEKQVSCYLELDTANEVVGLLPKVHI